MKRIGIIILAVVYLTGCQKEIQDENVMNEAYNLQITFTHKVGNVPMQLGTTYQNAFDEPYTLTAFKYYISNIKLQNNQEFASSVPGVYQLVDEASENTKSFTVKLTSGRFTSISYLIGVDSTRNVSGTQSGDLDPTKGMFWTWNSGYIMAKMEATSPVSTAPANKVELHVGGFRTGENSLRTATFNFTQDAIINIQPGGTSEVIIEADANKWFNSKHAMPISSFPVSTSPGDVSMKFADNYAKMFKVVAVNN